MCGLRSGSVRLGVCHGRVELQRILCGGALLCGGVDDCHGSDLWTGEVLCGWSRRVHRLRRWAVRIDAGPDDAQLYRRVRGGVLLCCGVCECDLCSLRSRIVLGGWCWRLLAVPSGSVWRYISAVICIVQRTVCPGSIWVHDRPHVIRVQRAVQWWVCVWAWVYQSHCLGVSSWKVLCNWRWVL